MPADKHASVHGAVLALLLLQGVSQVAGQTVPERPAGPVRTDAASAEPEQTVTGNGSGANLCTYVPLFSKEAGMLGAEENDPERDMYGYILVGDECH